MKLFLALFAMVSLVTGMAAAAPKHDPRIPSWEQSHLEEGDVSMRSLYILAVCIRSRRPAHAEAFLATRPGSAEEAKSIPLVLPPGEKSCPIRTTELRIRNLGLLRGAVAEAFYNVSRARPLTATPLPESVEAAMPPNNGIASPQRRIGNEVAACAVRRNPRLPHDVVQFNPGSVGEYRALRALDATFLSCLPAGESLRVSRLGIRAAIAETLYYAWRAEPSLFRSKAAREASK